MIERRKTKIVSVGNIFIGSKYPITVQSMTSTDTSDIKKTIKQIKKLEHAGCEIIRVAVRNNEDAKSLREIKKNIKIPLIADIQYDYRLALSAIDYDADGIRINPGNIKKHRIEKIAKLAKEKNICIRIGANSGSINKEYLKKYSGATADALVYSVYDNIKLFEDSGFENIKISLKATDVQTTVFAYQRMAELVDYPFHLGITGAGLFLSGTIKSAIGIGALLLQGIGDTIRVSLTDEPIKEIKVGQEILKSLNLRNYGPVIISCPSCARSEIDVIKIAKEVEKKLSTFTTHTSTHIPELSSLRVAVMGCSVNGPGEAKHCDIGITGTKGVGFLFKKGKIIKKVKEKHLVDELMEEIKILTNCL